MKDSVEVSKLFLVGKGPFGKSFLFHMFRHKHMNDDSSIPHSNTSDTQKQRQKKTEKTRVRERECVCVEKKPDGKG